MFILYSENHFRPYNLDSLRIFCSEIGLRATNCVQTLTIGNGDHLRWSRWRTAIDDDYRHSFRFFSQMTSLKSLVLLIENEFYRASHIPAPMCASGVLLSKTESDEMLPVLLPNIPKTVVEFWLRAGTEIMFEITMRNANDHISVCRRKWMPVRL